MAFTTFNPADIANGSLSGGNLTFTGNGGATDGGARAIDFATTTGKLLYAEAKFTGTIGAHDNFGIANSSAVLTTINSSGVNACAIAVADATTRVFSNGGLRGLGASGAGPMVSTDVMCMAVDTTNQNVWFRLNAGNWNNSGTADPTTNTGGYSYGNLAAGATSIAVVMSVSNGVTTAWTINFGASTFAQTVPSGYVGWPGSAVTRTPTLTLMGVG